MGATLGFGLSTASFVRSHEVRTATLVQGAALLRDEDQYLTGQ